MLDTVLGACQRRLGSYPNPVRLLTSTLVVVALLAFGGCAETAQDKAQTKYYECKNGVGHECGAQNRQERVEKEAHEAEQVLAKRHAEELADAAEGR